MLWSEFDFRYTYIEMVTAAANIRDLLTEFSPSLDFFVISSGDGRIKIWDTVRGQIQTEFTDIVSTGEDNFFGKPERGHLSVDYTCMKWLSLDKKKKRKLGSSLLVLGTGGGDVLALDVAAGQLKWRVSDCHPGGVSAISFHVQNSCIYTAGADGYICKLEPMTGNLLGKFKASSKAISTMSVSADGETFATAAAQLKVFNCLDNSKIQKFSGHPGTTRCLVFTDDGKYILSSAIYERYVAIWKLDGSKKHSTCCVLAMDHPPIYVDARCSDVEDSDASGFYVFAISEMGICYFWFGKNMEDLHNTKPTKVSVSLDDHLSKSQKAAVPIIFGGKLQAIGKPASSAHVFLAYGLSVKPSFEKILLNAGTDIIVNSSSDGILLPISQSRKSKKGSNVRTEVRALDRANAEGALLPLPKILDFHEKKKRHNDYDTTYDEAMIEEKQPDEMRGGTEKVGQTPNICIEEKLRSLGLLGKQDDPTTDLVPNFTNLKGINIEATLPPKKMRAVILAMAPSDAYKLFEALVAMWQSRSGSGKYVLPWISSILVVHSDYIVSQETYFGLLDSFYKLTKSKGAPLQSMLQLSGRLQLVTAQIDKAVKNEVNNSLVHADIEDEEEGNDDSDVDDVLYGEEDDDSESNTDDE